MFDTLWKNFPHNNNIKARCFNDQPGDDKDGPFSDYCAIRMSDCFIKSSINISKFSGNRCWSHAGDTHLLLAEDLANGLAGSPPSGFGRKEEIRPGDFQNTLADRTGVIFFGDYWQRGKETFPNRTGDHIDLWKKNQITGSTMFWRSVAEFFGQVSDLNDSKRVWFWEVK